MNIRQLEHLIVRAAKRRWPMSTLAALIFLTRTGKAWTRASICKAVHRVASTSSSHAILTPLLDARMIKRLSGERGHAYYYQATPKAVHWLNGKEVA